MQNSCKKSRSGNREKSALAGSGRLLLPLTINKRTPFCYLIFPLLAKPTTRGNVNNSHLILFHILLVRIILQQRGRFICKSFSFAFYYLLDDVVNSKVLLFANHLHLNIICIWLLFLFANRYYLIIIIIWISFAFEYHNHLPSIIIWISFAFEYHLHLNIIIK